MSDFDDATRLDPCGCCEADLPEPEIYNRPGQPALSYRVGTHSAFLLRMLARLPSQIIPDGPTLEKLTTRATDDPAIALLDAWATAADVLTFYQERIANEGYLRTAAERRSVLEMARAIGYELNPGVAASVYLVFTVEDAPGAPGISTVPKGTKIQSIPAQGKLPQTFETSNEIIALAEWNLLRPRLTRPQDLAIYNGDLYLLGTNNSLTVGSPGVVEIPIADLYLISQNVLFDDNTSLVPAIKVEQVYIKGTTTSLKAGDRLLLVGKKGDSQLSVIPLPILRVAVESDLDRTRVDLAEEPQAPPFKPPTFTPATFSATPLIFNGLQIRNVILKKSWKNRDLNAFLTINRWNPRAVLKNIATPTPPPKLPPADQGIFSFRSQTGFFGHNAPRWETLPTAAETRGGTGNDPYGSPWDGTNERTIWTNSQGQNYTDADVYFERSLPEVLKSSWVIFEMVSGGGTLLQAYRVSLTGETSLVDYGISGKSTGLNLETPDGSTPTKDPVSPNFKDFRVRRTTAYAQSELLDLAQLPIEEPLEEAETDEQGETVIKGAQGLMLDRMVLGLQVGHPLMLSGEQEDASGVIRHEVVILEDIVHEGGFTILKFRDRLIYRYVRKTVTLSANVALATHGETMREPLGSGDGTKVNQRFTLKKPPLTYISAPTPSGSETTLQVRVNDVLWQEVPSLYSLDARGQSYIVRIEDDGKTSVTFGDGKSGTRLPTGTENVTAVYRSGIGPGGEVQEESLTLLQTRPLGIRGVTNPQPASGAAPPETLDDARIKAPRTVLTLDRIVSLRDFEDFARSFAGIGKAQAIALQKGETRLVHITIAASNGDPVDTASPLFENLSDAIDSVRDPVQKVALASFQPLLFNLEAEVLIDSRYTPALVLAAVEEAIKAAFSFEKRAFGQPVTAAEAVTVIQKVVGVIAVDLNRLYLASDPDGPAQTEPPALLPAATATWSGSQIEPAQLLTINPVGITVEEMEAK